MTHDISVEMEWIPKINSHFRLQWEEAQQAYVLLYPEGMVKLNFSGGEILTSCDGSSSVSDIIGGLKRKFPEAENLDQDVLEFLSTAFERRWLVHSECQSSCGHI